MSESLDRLLQLQDWTSAYTLATSEADPAHRFAHGLPYWFEATWAKKFDRLDH